MGGRGFRISYQTIFNEEAQEFDVPATAFGITFGMAFR